MDFWIAARDIIILLAFAFVLGLLMERARQSALIGYLLAGTLLGPGGFNVIQDEAVIRGLAELGVALLLFSIGLEFSWRRLRALGRVALLGGALQIVCTAALGTLIGVTLGLGLSASVALGLVIAPSSTACVLRVLYQRAELDSMHGRASLGILLLQDIALVPLVLIMTVLGSDSSRAEATVQLAQSLGLAAVVVVGFYGVTTYILPRILDAAALSRNRELPILLAVTTCLAAAWVAHALQLSPVLGAFVAGVLLAESPYATWIRADASAIRTIFVTLFFASIGMIDSLGWLKGHWHWLALGVPAIVVGKAAVVWVVAWLCRVPMRHALAAGLCLAQTGEFSFVLVGIAHEGTLLGEDVFRFMVAATVVTLLLTPYLVAGGPGFGRWLVNSIGRGKRFRQEPSATAPTGVLSGHVIVVGLGPAGRAVCDTLKGEFDVAVIDLNPGARTLAEPGGPRVEIGDATQETVLERVNVGEAGAVVITLPDHRSAVQVAGLARQIAPMIRIYARARYHRHAPDFERHQVECVDEESVTGGRLGTLVLEGLRVGRSPDIPPADTPEPGP